ncbi:MAG: serine hydrolase [Ilumatobacteraceae bacterium]
MDGAQHEDRTQRAPGQFVVRQALVAIAVALLAIGAITAVSGGDDDGGNSSISPGFVFDTTVAGTSETSIVLASGASTNTDAAITVPVDTDVADTTSTAGAPAGSGNGTIVTPIVTPIVTTTALGVPSIDAKAFAVYDVTNNRWLADNGADTPMPVGSVMKLLTTYVVLQAGDLSKVVSVPKLTVDIDESSIGLYEGERLPRDVLLRAMLIVSANDAARSLATDVGGSIDGFVTQMNAAAQSLGMSNTVAANPIGLDAADAHSSAHDMISLAALLMQNQTFREAVIKPSANLHGQTFSTTNGLLTTYRGATGVKTGHTTQAGYCLIGAATRDGRSLIVAVLGAQTDVSRLQGATALLDWGFAQP